MSETQIVGFLMHTIMWEADEHCQHTHIKDDIKEALKQFSTVIMNLNASRNEVSRDVRKPVFGVSDQVRHKPACTSSEKS